jgi:hypothetical protein
MRSFIVPEPAGFVKFRPLGSDSVLQIRIQIRIRRIHMFLGLPEAHPDPLVRDTDPDLDPSIIKKNSKKTLIPTVL